MRYAILLLALLTATGCASAATYYYEVGKYDVIVSAGVDNHAKCRQTSDNIVIMVGVTNHFECPGGNDVLP